MPGVLDLCEKYFKTRNLYEVLEIEKNVSAKEIKKAYHKISLSVHPDRVDESEKLEATEKFKVLGKVHAILSDTNKKAVYDESGSVDDDDEVTERNWEEYWRMLFKPITEEDIANYEKDYKGSETEIRDVKKAYLEGKGDMDVIMDGTPFAHTADEPRLRAIIQGLIDSEDLPAYKIFTNEPAQKMKRRHKRAEKEAKEVENLNKMLEIEKEDKEKENNLALMIRKKQEERGAQMDSFFDKLAAKYGGEEKKKPKEAKSVKRKATPGTRTSSRTASKRQKTM